MANLIFVDILDKVIDPKYWKLEKSPGYWTRHLYRNSPIETDYTCGNCNSAHCDECKFIEGKEEFVFTADFLQMVNILMECGVPKDDAYEIVAWDGSFRRESNYRYRNPDIDDLKTRYPDFYNSLINKNEVIK